MFPNAFFCSRRTKERRPPYTFAEWTQDINGLRETMDGPSDTSSDEEGDNGVTLSELSEQYQTAKRRYKEQK